MNKKVLVSLHDVTPFHLERIRQAETYFLHWGISRITYLFIPDYHSKLKNGEYERERLNAFKRDVLEKEHSHLNVEWILHGYFHRERLEREESLFPPGPGEERVPLTLGRRWQRKYLTAGEGEFLALSAGEIGERLERGKAAFRAFFNREPVGFVAPAWLYNHHLLPELKPRGFFFTEDHTNIYLLQHGIAVPAPVITWATRTPLRQLISRFGCPMLSRFWSGKEYLRIAVHPYDFDHPTTVRSIDQVMRKIMKEREVVFYSDILD